MWMRKSWSRIFLGGLCTSVTSLGSASTMNASEPPPGGSAQTLKALTEHRETVERIVQSALGGNDAWSKMEQLCDGIGHRLSGSPQLEKAIDWAMAAMQQDGLDNVRREKVMVPHWVRGEESATLIDPSHMPLCVLGLGGSVGTPPEGITAPILVVADADELESLGEKVKGKIVLFNNPMPPYDPEKGSGYGTAVKYRHKGAQLCGKQGAVASLVRSVTARSLRTPHTGGTSYGDCEIKIPTAALCTEDAELLARLQRRGMTPVVNLKMGAQTLPDAESANVIGELRGREKPEEIVVLSGHLDSWDVGQGAHDDGGGCVSVMEALHVLRKLNLAPRRTIRVVLWTNEENGLRGAKQYVIDHADEMKNHVFAIESDGGVFAPQGFSLECSDADRAVHALAGVNELLALIPSLGPLKAIAGGSGADIGEMKPFGVILMGHDVEGSSYFDYHHTPADTLDKVSPQHLSQNVALLAATAYMLAEMELP